MEALSREFKIVCSWELIDADDLVVLMTGISGLKKDAHNLKKQYGGKRAPGEVSITDFSI